jgi:hypothetical protein
MLQSLDAFGNYRGEILVLTDRDEDHVRRHVPCGMQDRTHFFKSVSPNVATRYLVGDYLGACDRPVLYVDTDIIVTQNVEPILRKINIGEGIYVCSEAILFPKFQGVPASGVRDKYASWFGLDLFLSDKELSGRPLLCLNSGLFGFSSRLVFEQVGLQVQNLYADDRWSAVARKFGDQAFFNYVLAKSERIDVGLLSGAVGFVADARSAAKFSRPFMHFLWARDAYKRQSLWTRGTDKRKQMSDYVEFLKGKEQ